ncbi:DUF6773 family protein [Alkaliphilus transvaalensis]|uniref:DUF6773 family protein n=1 Tax=Alkaliphilus transvaalensis TaxID=114628 RepID=UPI000478E002|nr:DUF6773 family protein [Alkaliphilus transvaalensis]
MKRIEDERIVSEKRKINSSAFGLCFLALWGILLYRQFMLQQNVAEYIDIFLLTVGLSIYVVVNNVLKGFYLTHRNKYSRKKVSIIGAFVGSITFTIVKFFMMKGKLSNIEDIFKLLASLIIFFTMWVISQSILFKISDNKANQDIE